MAGFVTLLVVEVLLLRPWLRIFRHRLELGTRNLIIKITGEPEVKIQESRIGY